MQKKSGDNKDNISSGNEVELTVGEFLKSEREKAEKTLEEISAATKISVKNLAALEKNDWYSLPRDVFVRGFIKLYANYLGIDEYQALDLYTPQNGELEKAVSEESIEEKIFETESLAEAPILLSSRQILSVIFLVLLGTLGYLVYQTYYLPPPQEKSTSILDIERTLSEQPVKTIEQEQVEHVEHEKLREIITIAPQKQKQKVAGDAKDTSLSEEEEAQSSVVQDDEEKLSVTPAEKLERTEKTEPPPEPKTAIENITESDITTQAPALPVTEEALDSPESKDILVEESGVSVEENLVEPETEAGAVPLPTQPDTGLDSQVDQTEPAIQYNYILKLTARRKTTVTISIDNDAPRYYTFFSGDERVWKANENIVVEMADSQAAYIILNNNQLDIPSSDGPVTVRIPEVKPAQ